MAAGRGWGLSPIRQFTPAVRLPENGFLLNLSVPLTTIKDFTTTVRERKNDFSLRSPLCVCVGGGARGGKETLFHNAKMDFESFSSDASTTTYQV